MIFLQPHEATSSLNSKLLDSILSVFLYVRWSNIHHLTHSHKAPLTKEFSRHAAMPPQQPHQIPISRFHVPCLFASPSCHQEILPSLSMSRVSSFLHATINSWLFNWVVMTRINTIYLLPHPAMARSPVHISLFRSSCVWPAAAEPRHDRFSVEDPSYHHGSVGAIVCTSARSSASSCWAPSAFALATASRGCRWVSVIDRIGGRRGWSSEPSIGSSVLNKMIVDDAYK